MGYHFAARGSSVPAGGIKGAGAAFIRWSRLVRMFLRGSEPAVRGTGRDALEDRISEAIRNERHRIADEIHEEALQFLMSTLSSLRLAERLLDYDHPALRPLRDGIQQVKVANDAIRQAIRPSILRNSGPSTLAVRVYQVAQRLGLGASVPVHVGPLPDLSATPRAEDAVVGIISEGLANVVKHARARNVWVEVSVNSDAVRCVVRDDGVGFDACAVESQSPMMQKLGLHLMQERASSAGGCVTIASNHNSGTVVEARIPLRPS